MLDMIADMKVVILAGGFGTRLAEETDVRPKPMVEIGGRPILWHIMMHYATYGFKNFVIALGYKGHIIKKYMTDFAALMSDLTVDLRTGSVTQDNNYSMDWRVELVDTGYGSETGGRLKRVAHRLPKDRPFLMTYGDGVSNVNLHELLAFHQQHGKLATLTAVRPPARFGHLVFHGNQIFDFREKAQTDEGWINGGFFVLEPEVVNFIEHDTIKWEREPLERLSQAGQLMAYKHEDFWQCMDALRDKLNLEKMWESGNAPWKTWTTEEVRVNGRS
jgi:glucose-1-phosphate cytidylyltransferase